jgi:hypothetical protein
VPRVELSDGQSFMVTSTSRFPLRGGFVDQTRLAWMAGQGIGHQLITFPVRWAPMSCRSTRPRRWCTM